MKCVKHKNTPELQSQKLYVLGVPLMRKIICLSAFALLSACAANNPIDSVSQAYALKADLYRNNSTSDAKPIGAAIIKQNAQGFDLALTVSGLNPGSYAIHLHETGKCEGPDFKSAGGHWNPNGKQHGLENPAGTHGGDLPNLTVIEGQKAELKLNLPDFGLTGQGGLMDADGAAFIIHTGPDDNKTDPSGNSGGRMICGVFKVVGTN
jgi:superoxide dismutase, Cu-Zn family